MNTNTTEHAKKAGSFISGLLTGWGVPANWARVITGAIVGAGLAAVALINPSCTASFSQTTGPDGQTSTTYTSTIHPLPLEETDK